MSGPHPGDNFRQLGVVPSSGIAQGLPDMMVFVRHAQARSP
ncbi:hypothetical protein HMPREF3223_01219 [Cutibacterium avidum]|nr:hypothetical protein HMPREF3223_01219 [Cutibacterium avidum]